MKDFYQVLGVDKKASSDEIKKAYKKKSFEFHPDHRPESVEDFKSVQEAYETLNDPVKRRAYDSGHTTKNRSRRKPPEPQKQHFYEDVVSNFFGGSTFRGRNIQVRLEIEFIEVLTGCSKSVKISKRNRCKTCQGRGFTEFQPCGRCKGTGRISVNDVPFEINTTCEVCAGTGKAAVVYCKDCLGNGFSANPIEKGVEVKIPAGILSGMQLRIVGEGEESSKTNGRNGDLIVFVIVKDHPYFLREGANINLEMPVSYTQLVMGDTIEIPTLDQGNLNVKIPPGSQPNTKIRLKGKGFPGPNGIMGDLYCILKLECPKELPEDYKIILDKLVDLEKKYVTPKIERWKNDRQRK